MWRLAVLVGYGGPQRIRLRPCETSRGQLLAVAVAVAAGRSELGRFEAQSLERVVDLLAGLLTELGGERDVAVRSANELRVVLELELLLRVLVREHGARSRVVGAGVLEHHVLGFDHVVAREQRRSLE